MRGWENSKSEKEIIRENGMMRKWENFKMIRGNGKMSGWEDEGRPCLK